MQTARFLSYLHTWRSFCASPRWHWLQISLYQWVKGWGEDGIVYSSPPLFEHSTCMWFLKVEISKALLCMQWGVYWTRKYCLLFPIGLKPFQIANRQLPSAWLICHSPATHVPEPSNSWKTRTSPFSSQHTPGLLKANREAEMADRKSWPTKELHSMQTPMRSRVYLFLCKIRLFLIDFDSQVKSANLSSRCTLTDLSLEVFYSLEDFSLAERRNEKQCRQ